MSMIDRTLNYGRQQIIDLTKSACAGRFDQTLSVLDCGAGIGEDLLGIKKFLPAAKLHAIENDPIFVAKLIEEGIVPYSLDIERDQLPFPSESLDLIISNQVLEHTKDVFWILHEMTRTLKVGGHLVLGVPNLAAFHNRVLLMIGRQPTPIKTASAHVRGFTQGDLQQFLNLGFPGGYKKLKLRGANFYPFPGFIAKPMACLWPTGAWSIFILWQKTSKYEKQFLEYPIVHELQTRFYLGNKFS